MSTAQYVWKERPHSHNFHYRSLLSFIISCCGESRAVPNLQGLVLPTLSDAHGGVVSPENKGGPLNIILSKLLMLSGPGSAHLHTVIGQ